MADELDEHTDDCASIAKHNIICCDCGALSAYVTRRTRETLIAHGLTEEQADELVAEARERGRTARLNLS
jgi:hypothetical protein